MISHCNIEKFRVVKKAYFVHQVKAYKIERTLHRRNNHDLSILSLEHLSLAHFDVSQVASFEKSRDFVRLFVVGCNDTYVLWFAVRPHPHQGSDVLEHTDGLVAVKPARRVGFTILFFFNAVPKE